MDQTLKSHEELIDKHEDKLEIIQQDLTDIKVRLGIKDKTNGQVVEYQQRLANAIESEREERKRMDEKLDTRTWMILTGVILSILLQLLPPII